MPAPQSFVDSERRVHLVMPLASGDLFDQISTRTIEEVTTAHLVWRVLAATAYAHEHGVVHLDIKHENILLFPDGGVKLADWGIARGFSAAHAHPFLVKATHLGSGQHLPPEAREILDTIAEASATLPATSPSSTSPTELLNQRVIDGRKADIWAIGILAVNCMTQRGVIVERDTRRVLTDPHLWEHLSPAGGQFLNDVLQIDPRARPSARELLHHSWFIACGVIEPHSSRASAATALAPLPGTAARGGGAVPVSSDASTAESESTAFTAASASDAAERTNLSVVSERFAELHHFTPPRSHVPEVVSVDSRPSEASFDVHSASSASSRATFGILGSPKAAGGGGGEGGGAKRREMEDDSAVLSESRARMLSAGGR